MRDGEPEVYTVNGLEGIVIEFANIFSIEISFDSIKAVFPEATTESIVVLTVSEGNIVELAYDEIDEAFVLDGLQGLYTTEALENAVVTLK